MDPEIVSMATMIEDKRTFSERETIYAASLRRILDKDTAGVAIEQYKKLFEPSHVRVVVSARDFDVDLGDLFFTKGRVYRIFSRTTIGELVGRASHDAENWFDFEFEYMLGGSEMYLMFDIEAPTYEDLPTDGRVIRGIPQEEADPRENVLEFLRRERKKDVFV